MCMRVYANDGCIDCEGKHIAVKRPHFPMEFVQIIIRIRWFNNNAALRPLSLSLSALHSPCIQILLMILNIQRISNNGTILTHSIRVILCLALKWTFGYISVCLIMFQFGRYLSLINNSNAQYFRRHFRRFTIAWQHCDTHRKLENTRSVAVSTTRPTIIFPFYTHEINLFNVYCTSG